MKEEEEVELDYKENGTEEDSLKEEIKISGELDNLKPVENATAEKK